MVTLRLAIPRRKSSALFGIQCPLLLLVLLAGCAQTQDWPSSAPLQEITSRQVKEMLSNNDVRVIDVRSENERLAGKVRGAVELLFGPIQWTERPVSAEDAESFLGEIRKMFPEKDTRMIVFCNVGIRSRAAGAILVRDGYTNGMPVRDGFLGNRLGEGLEAQGF